MNLESLSQLLLIFLETTFHTIVATSYSLGEIILKEELMYSLVQYALVDFYHYKNIK